MQIAIVVGVIVLHTLSRALTPADFESRVGLLVLGAAVLICAQVRQAQKAITETQQDLAQSQRRREDAAQQDHPSWKRPL